ncbi:ClpA/B-type protease [Azotobacter vinelandii CA]|uniref:ClpA/B-type protease n=3 Tax=Azotobacter vinelandii TaxID=354 RepID=C1DJR8_AZOVD|nr:type VI secretion system ATPase TssH [Azotobacter vinelandii]ACO78837.1 ClpA/B-type protease [Azotobacter vinelandii DJ]AGK16589.1 ClpA/B-type protease [Azotobacter vinelandii CA]AGK20789.1 ClpA/B-type protease [Azotobacter vinelandii CA6]SFX31661.1 type VI secretion system protein VasG [Azotobacter vinelandii]
MSDISRVSLFGKLDPLLFSTLEKATAFCRQRGNPYVELAHWLFQQWQESEGDLRLAARHFELDGERLERDLQAALDRLPRGAGAVSDLSGHIDDAVERAWVYGSLKFGAARIRGAHLLIGLLRTAALRHLLFGISREFERILPDVLGERLDSILAGSSEEVVVSAAAAGAPSPAADRALEQYGVNLSERARTGEIDPVTGRDGEIRQMVDVLLRRRQNNPLLTGEAGVGKTAVVEGLALRIAAGEVPPPLREVELYLLDIGLLQAGASVKGEFERRLRQLIDEVRASPRPIVLFIDEIHTLMGAGGNAGTGDAANLLKPMLARGELRTIGATTWAEYKRHIEKDPALTRRFQVVQIHEPDEERALAMIRGLAGKLAHHHGVLLLDEALRAAVSLSHRYIPARQLPDKAVSLLDTACARVAVSQHALPPELEDCRRRIETLRVERGIVEHECAIGAGDASRLDELATRLAGEEAECERLMARWRDEQELAARIFDLRARLGGGAATPAEEEVRRPLLAELYTVLAELEARQQDEPLILPAVDTHAVAAVVADWTGIPVGRMLKDEAAAVLNLADTLAARVIGQRHGLEAIARRIRTARARLDDPGKPVGVFLLAGPSGVGKTETALALAEALYGGEQNLIVINMSEFQEAHTVSTLKGAPPGYVGYGEGGVLTEAVRRRPYSVVLLDEVEKAHPDVHEIFFQVFDKGWMEDGEGRRIDFKNTLIILTSNVGSDLLMRLCQDPQRIPDPEALAGALREPLRRVFPAALLGRLSVVPYYPLSDEMLARIVRLQLERIGRRLRDNHGIDFHYAQAAVQLVGARCTEVESGGRMVDAILTHTVLPHISRELLLRAGGEAPLTRIQLDAEQGEFVYRFESGQTPADAQRGRD